MNRYKKLLQKREDLVREGRTILAAAEHDARGLNEKEAVRFDAIDAELVEVNKIISQEETQFQREEGLRAIMSNETGDRAAASRGGLLLPPARLPGGGSMNFGASRDNPWTQGFGEFLGAVIEASRADGRIDERLMRPKGAASGLNEAIGSDGGFLVQQDYASELLKRTYEMGQITSRIRRIPVGANANGLKVNAMDESSRATGSRWGGVRGYWGTEAGLKTGSQPKFRKMELELKKLTGLCYATDEVLQDAQALEAVIQEAFPAELNFLLEDSIFNGSGAGQPLGFMNGGSLITVAKETGQLARTIESKNIVNMWARLWARSQQNAVWLVNQDTFPELYTMGITIGTGGAPIFMPPGGLSGSPYATLLGRPIIPVEYCSTLGTAGDIVLVDLSQYLAIDKGGIQSASSIHVRFLYDETCFRFVYRVDGQPIWNKDLAPFKGSNTVSPFVCLATRA
jgi:HK97 family phage major capsid protein